MGQSGTGSMSVKRERVFVPEHRAPSMLKGRNEGFPAGRPTWPVFRVPFGGLAHCVLGTMVGNAQAMFDAVTNMVTERSTSYTTPARATSNGAEGARRVSCASQRRRA